MAMAVSHRACQHQLLGTETSQTGPGHRGCQDPSTGSPPLSVCYFLHGILTHTVRCTETVCTCRSCNRRWSPGGPSAGAQGGGMLVAHHQGPRRLQPQLPPGLTPGERGRSIQEVSISTPGGDAGRWQRGTLSRGMEEPVWTM